MTTLDDIRARLEVATAGPWIVDPDESSIILKPDQPNGWDGTAIAYTVEHDAGLFPAEHNGEFIAHARTDIPKLIAALDAVVEQLDSFNQVFIGDGPGDIAVRGAASILRTRITAAIESGAA